MKKIISLFLSLILILSLAACNAEPEETTEIPVETTEAPAQTHTEEDAERLEAYDFTVYDWDGNPVRLSDMKGIPVVLNFWASWCPPCRAEMPEFDEIAKEYEGKVAFMMVNLTDGESETLDSAKSLIESMGYTFPVYFDTTSEAAYTYGIQSIPITFFIDAEGYFVAYYEGSMPGETLRVGISMIYSEISDK